jgi:hypothetical protein
MKLPYRCCAGLDIHRDTNQRLCKAALWIMVRRWILALDAIVGVRLTT